jgi:hypothetical protein
MILSGKKGSETKQKPVSEDEFETSDLEEAERGWR